MISKRSSKRVRKLMDKLVAHPGRKISLKDYDPDWTGSIKDKEEAVRLLEDGVKQLAKQQDMLYAQDTYSLLVVFQAMDAAGKDGTIRHVMSGVNPQGCQVFSFKAPSAEERDHDYLWRTTKALPERGRIGIHNRSYYEEVLVCRVHPEILASQQLPADRKKDGIWKRRFEQINNFEAYLSDNGTVIVKFFLHVSKKEQKRRFLERIDENDKNWKFSVNDAKERVFWKDYMRAYEDVFTHTSTKHAPWYIIPADNKWFMRLAVAAIIYQTLEDLKLKYPTVSKEKKNELLEARKVLMAEKD
jgi:PPK2 family polyphosphate:nucleotide phosphotransferase